MKDLSPKEERRKYSESFKREAVMHWLASGKSAETISAELGIGADRLYVWKQRYSPPTAVEAEDLRVQLTAAREELARVTEQRDILKKTLGILSTPSDNGLNG